MKIERSPLEVAKIGETERSPSKVVKIGETERTPSKEVGRRGDKEVSEI